MKRSKKTFILAAVLVLLLAGARIAVQQTFPGQLPWPAPGRGQCFLLPGEQPRPPLLPFPLRTRKGIYWICPT